MGLIVTGQNIYLVQAQPLVDPLDIEIVAVKLSMEEAEAFIADARERQAQRRLIVRNFFVTVVPVGWDEEDDRFDDLPSLSYPAYRYNSLENTLIDIEE